MSKQFLAVIIAVIVVLVGIFALSGDNKSDTSNGKSTSNAKPSENRTGQGKSGVTLVEYGDFQCPFCAQYYPVLKQVKQQFDEQIYFQFRNYPLQNIHQNAFAAARAAEAAALQGKFWEMHDKLYENQPAWSESKEPSTFFTQYAQQIGLNADQFKKDYASTAVNNTVNADLAAGRELKVDSTPTFFLDGKKIEVTANVSSFEKQIKEAIAKKSQQQN